MKFGSLTHQLCFERRYLAEFLCYHSLIERAVRARLTNLLPLCADLLHQRLETLLVTLADRLHLSLLRIGQIEISECGTAHAAHAAEAAATPSLFAHLTVALSLSTRILRLRYRKRDSNGYRQNCRDRDCFNSIYFAHVTSLFNQYHHILSKVPLDKTPSAGERLQRTSFTLFTSVPCNHRLQQIV